MQAQTLRQSAVSPQQSLEVVKTLLSASFGCIAYLRNLLPEDNFSDGRLTSGERGPIASNLSSQDAGCDKRQVSGVKIKTVARGYSTEADKLLNYLEYGIFDAIGRQYLKSFIFAIYLDSDDPNNIIEAYTYKISYHTIPGTKTTVPIMSLDEQLNSLSLASKIKNPDPVACATLQGKAPTLGDVKLSVKNLVKSLILTTQSLEPLPRRRFATFKLFYRENTPMDYEPPYFRPGDPKNDRFVFTTHNISEVPEKISVGSVTTPHHGIDVKVQSVARYIPNVEDNTQKFLGFQDNSKSTLASNVTAGMNARSQQIDAQMKDAGERSVAWMAEDPRWMEEDAEGEPDPDYVNDSGIAFDVPLGMRKQDGTIVPAVQQEDVEMSSAENEPHFYGKPEVVPDRVGQLRSKGGSETLESTQILDNTQAPIIKQASTLALIQETGVSDASGSIDTQVLRSALRQSTYGVHDMLDLETQVVTSGNTVSRSREDSPIIPKIATHGQISNIGSLLDQANCACSLDDGDDLVFCEECKSWMHLWCMGYHSPEDTRLPEKYVCIPCRLQTDVYFHLIRDLYPNILSAYTDLAHFRRAIKIAEKNNPESLKEFRKLAKCEASLSEQLWNRLEREGFIALEITEVDKLGLAETRTRTNRAAVKKVKGPKQVQRYIFDMSSKKGALYSNYFSPDSEAEKRLLGITNVNRETKQRKEKPLPQKGENQLKRHSVSLTGTTKNKRGVIEAPENHPLSDAGASFRTNEELGIESQTQEDTQYDKGTSNMNTDAPSVQKRRPRSSMDQHKESAHRVGKKMKISLGEEGIDIEE